jgi:hypothetical protein
MRDRLALARRARVSRGGGEGGRGRARVGRGGGKARLVTSPMAWRASPFSTHPHGVEKGLKN